VLETPKRRQFSAEYKARIVQEADLCTQWGQIGALLRREGLHWSQLRKWRAIFRKAIRGALKDDKRGRKRTKQPLEAENERLRKQIGRLEQRLKQAETIIDVQKKSRRCWGYP